MSYQREPLAFIFYGRTTKEDLKADYNGAYEKFIKISRSLAVQLLGESKLKELEEKTDKIGYKHLYQRL